MDEDQEDLQLHRALRAGDRDAFSRLFTKYSPAAYGVALRICRQPALAQEVVSDAFMAMWRAPEAYDPARGKLRTFVLSLAHHRAVDTVRREERLRKRTTDPMNLDAPEGEDVAEGVVEDAFLAERRVQVREALTTLSDDQRTVLELAYFEGMTQTQIAAHLDIPLGTVKTRTLAAMRKLRTALQEEDA